MMAWPEGPGTARTVTGPRTDSAAAVCASQAGTAPTARAALRSRPATRHPAADAHRPRPLLCPAAELSQARCRATPWSSLVAGLASHFPAQPRPASTPRPALPGSFPDATYSVICVDSERAGRLIVNHADNQILIVDIALLPEFRRTGIGSGLVQRLLDGPMPAICPSDATSCTTAPPAGSGTCRFAAQGSDRVYHGRGTGTSGPATLTAGVLSDLPTWRGCHCCGSGPTISSWKIATSGLRVNSCPGQSLLLRAPRPPRGMSA